MYGHQNFMRLNDIWMLAFDDRQWILQRRTNADGKPETWLSILFISSSRATLMRYLDEYGALKQIKPDKMVALNALPETCQEWLRQRQASEKSEAAIPDLGMAAE